MSGWIGGSAPSFLKRRSSDSEAQRYCVGFSPMREKTLRQALISASSLSVPAASSRDCAMALRRATGAAGETSVWMPSANSVLAPSSGKRLQMSG